MPKKVKKRHIRVLVKTLKLDLKSIRFSYKQSEFLAKFVNDWGSIISRKETGLTAKLQRRLAVEVKRARHLALLPFTQTVK